MGWNTPRVSEPQDRLRESQGDSGVEVPAQSAPQDDKGTPLQFLTQNADDSSTKLYRASDESGLELFAAFLTDGRVRIADDRAHRFAGMIENGRADLLDVANNEWSELFLHVSPNGQTQFELRGGPYDAHVLVAIPFDSAQDDQKLRT